MVTANSTSWSERWPSGLSERSRARIEQRVERGAQFVRHVRQELRLVLGGVASSAAFSSSSALERCNSACWSWSSSRAFLELDGEALGLAEQGLGTGVGDDGVDGDADGVHELVDEGQVDLAEAAERGQFDDAEQLVLEEDRDDDDAGRGRLAEPAVDRDVVRRGLLDEDPLLLRGRLPDQAVHRHAARVDGRALRRAVPGDEGEYPWPGAGGPQRGAVLVRVGQEERAVLGVHQRGQLAQDQVGDLDQVAVALHQRGETGQVGLQPVLRAGGLAEVGHHQVDVVLQLGDLALGLHGDGAGHVALGDGAATSAIARTWVVRFSASSFTFVVSRFQVP